MRGCRGEAGRCRTGVLVAGHARWSVAEARKAAPCNIRPRGSLSARLGSAAGGVTPVPTSPEPPMSQAKTFSDDETVHYDGPSGGWGSVRGIARIFGKEWATPLATETLFRQNKPRGFMCVSCSWAKPADYHPFEFCENGAKATLWELTTRRCTPDFFAKHTLAELRSWKDYDLEQQGRLTHPLRYDSATDRYVPCAWEEAFEAIGSQLKA